MFQKFPVLMIALVVVLIGVAVFALKASMKQAQRKASNQFKAKPFLTPNELEFLQRLETAVPELRFHAQVSMGALLDPVVTRKQDSRAYMSARGQFSQKIVDFLAQRRDNGAIVALIELDDRTHRADKDRARDAMLLQGGYRVIRWQSADRPQTAAIRSALQEATAAQAAAPVNSVKPAVQ